MADDDDDDDDDDRDNNRPQQNRGRNNKPKGGGSKNRDVDLSSDPSFAWRFLKTTLSSFANDLGKLGYDVPAVRNALTTIEAVLGPSVTSMGLNALAAGVQNPKFVKDWIRSHGLPEQINALGDEFIDDVFEGLRMALRGDVLNTDGANKALANASARLATKAGVLKAKNFEEAFMLLEPNDQVYMNAILTALSTEANAPLRKEFDAYRPRLASVIAQKTLIKCVIKPPPAGSPTGTASTFATADVVAYLKRTFGEIKPSAPLTAFVALGGVLSKVTGKIGEAVKRFTEHPDQSFNEIAVNMEQRTQQAQPAADARRDRLAELKRQK